MFSLIKGLCSLAVAAMVVYALFFVDLGGHSLAGHISHIWSSDVVQVRVDAIRSDVKASLQERLAEAERRAAVELGEEYTHRGELEISADDRKELERILEAAAHPNE